MTDRKNELATMCAVEIRKTSALAKSHMADYGYHLIESVVDAEFWSMIPRLAGKPVAESDMPILRELVLADLWPRLKAAHRERREAAFGSLISGNNDIVVRGAEFSFDIGWLPLVDEAVERIRTYPSEWRAMIVGGKEKFGCLVLHIACDTEQPGCRSEVERLREEIRLRSLATCDICSGQGRLRLSSIAKTVCDKHAAVLGDLREDDGVWADPWKWHEERPLTDHIADVVATAREIMAGVDPLRATALGKRIDNDTWAKRGREQELLIEFGGAIEDAVVGAVVKEEYLDDYISKEIDGWRTTAVVPVTDRDREFLHRYLKDLIRAEYERVKGK